VGQEAGNAGVSMGRTTPWLQEVAGTPSVWTDWMVAYRDVVILDENNVRIGVFNLTVNDLGQPQNYAALKQLLLNAAQ